MDPDVHRAVAEQVDIAVGLGECMRLRAGEHHHDAHVPPQPDRDASQAVEHCVHAHRCIATATHGKRVATILEVDAQHCHSGAALARRAAGWRGQIVVLRQSNVRRWQGRREVKAEVGLLWPQGQR